MHTDLARDVSSDAAWWGSGVYSPVLDWPLPLRAGTFRRSVEVPEGKGRLIVEWEGEEPAWVEPSLNALAESLELPTNWDSYGSHRVGLNSVVSAGQALCLIMRSDTIPPTVVPTPGGGIQLEWHTRGLDLEIEVSPLGRAYIFCHDQTEDTRWEGDLSFNLSRIQDVTARLSRHG